jgi:hypothetical protein
MMLTHPDGKQRWEGVGRVVGEMGWVKLNEDGDSWELVNWYFTSGI